MPRRVDHRLVPGAALVLDFDPSVMIRAYDGPDSEGSTWEAGAAVLGGVGGEFGGAQDHIVCSRVDVEDCAQVGADSPDVLGATGIGDLGCV